MCIFFWQITFSSVENTTLVNSHRGKYSSLKKLKNTRTEVYILKVEKSFKYRKHHFSQLAQRYIFFRQKAFLIVENAIFVNLHRGINSSLKKLKTLPLRCKFFEQKTFLSVENIISVSSHGGEYSSIKHFCREYVLRVEKS